MTYFVDQWLRDRPQNRFARDGLQQAAANDSSCGYNRSQVDRIIRTRGLSAVYQPAIRLANSQIEFVESLARFVAVPYRSPDEWFAIASEVGLACELEILAIEVALAGLHALPPSSSISINVSPETIMSQSFGLVIGSAPVDRIIVEITEHKAVPYYSDLNDALAEARKLGLRVAVDDLGAGYSSLNHVLEIRPDLIKLDTRLVRDIDKDPARRALVTALTSFSKEIGCELVAEGVETEEELRTLSSLGVAIVQGFFLGRPLPLQNHLTSFHDYRAAMRRTARTSLP